MSNVSEKEENNDSNEPKHYECFCLKIYTTYSGIYLHLKSKHFQLFVKYKKLKITKLFKKIKRVDGAIILQLEKITDKTASIQFEN